MERQPHKRRELAEGSGEQHRHKKRKLGPGVSIDQFARAKASSYDPRAVKEKERALAAKVVNKYRKLKQRLQDKLQPPPGRAAAAEVRSGMRGGWAGAVGVVVCRKGAGGTLLVTTTPAPAHVLQELEEEAAGVAAAQQATLLRSAADMQQPESSAAGAAAAEALLPPKEAAAAGGKDKPGQRRQQQQQREQLLKGADEGGGLGKKGKKGHKKPAPQVERLAAKVQAQKVSQLGGFSLCRHVRSSARMCDDHDSSGRPTALGPRYKGAAATHWLSLPVPPLSPSQSAVRLACSASPLLLQTGGGAAGAGGAGAGSSGAQGEAGGGGQEAHGAEEVVPQEDAGGAAGNEVPHREDAGPAHRRRGLAGMAAAPPC